MNDAARTLRRQVLRIALAWVALLALMGASLFSAYLPLGAGNLAAGLGIATLKSLIVLCLFMGLWRAPALLRMVAAIGFAMLLLLLALTRVDWGTRAVEPAPLQQPRQLDPLGRSS